MKTLFGAILLLTLPLLGFSQQESSVDFIGGLDYSFRHISSSSNVAPNQEILTSRKENERGKANWRIGININKRLSENIYLKSGLRFASVGYSIASNSIFKYPNQHNGQGGWDPTIGGDPNEIKKILADYFFLEIPVVVRKEFRGKKLTPFVELGILPSYYIRTMTTSISDIDRNFDYSKNDFRNLHLVGVISAGINYNYSDKNQLFIQPTFRYHLTKLIDAPITENLYSAGLEFGLRRKI